MHENLLIRADRLLDEKTLEFLGIFNELCYMEMQLNSDYPTLHLEFDRYCLRQDGGTSPKDKIRHKQQLLIGRTCAQYGIDCVEHLSFLMNIREFYMPLDIKAVHNSIYCLAQSSSNALGNLHKILQTVHKDGFIRQLLGLKLPCYSLDGVIVQPYDKYTGLVIEDSHIFYASLDAVSLQYKKSGNTFEDWGKPFFPQLQSRLLYHKFNHQLHEKETSTGKTKI